MDKKLKILTVGAGGGREHALAWKIKQSPRAGELFFARGNAGTAKLGTNLDIKETEIEELINFAQKEKIDLVLVVSDDPLALGVVDQFKKRGFRAWGPSQAASKLEWSKAFAKDFMKRHNLPTAKFEIFEDFEKAKEYARKQDIGRQDLPVVIKADGLAFGKGVTIAQTHQEALSTLEEIMTKKIFGTSGNKVVIEEFLSGPEISIHALSDGKSYKIFPTSQDHKRIKDNDQGPNTGGMGVIGPLPFVDKTMLERIEREIIAPTLKAMTGEGIPFEGVLYPSLMLTKEGPKIIEFNARFGDPECQVYMRLLDTDLLEILNACVDKKLSTVTIKWKNLSACNIALASGGYPGEYEKGKEIFGLNSPLEEYPKGEVDSLSTPAKATPQEGNNIVIFHAGTKLVGDKIVTNGGRVLGVSATGKNLKESLDKAYKAINKISFEEMQYRKDIGKKALKMIK